MKIKVTPLALITLAISTILLSCKKDGNCSDAVCTIKNTSSTVIHFAYDSRIYNDSILVGQSTQKHVGKIVTRPWVAQWPAVNFFSDHGDHEWVISKCDTEQDVN